MERLFQKIIGILFLTHAKIRGCYKCKNQSICDSSFFGRWGYNGLMNKPISLFIDRFFYHSVQQSPRSFYHHFRILLHAEGYPTHKCSHQYVGAYLSSKQLVILIHGLIVAFEVIFRMEGLGAEKQFLFQMLEWSQCSLV